MPFWWLKKWGGIHFRISFFLPVYHRRERCSFLFCECKVTQNFPFRKQYRLCRRNEGAFFYIPLYFSCLSFARYIIILQTKETVMNQANVKVSFYLKKSEADADGNCPVMAKLNVGKYSEAAFSVKISLDFRTCFGKKRGGKRNQQSVG